MFLRHSSTPTPVSTFRTWAGRGLVASGVLLAAAFVVILPTAVHADGNAGSFLAHLNGLRANHGLAPLALAGDLNAVAQSHTQEMASQGRIFHNGALATQVTNGQTVGENVGTGSSEDAIDEAFDNSPGHLANELDTGYTQVGIGSVTAPNGQLYVTLDFRQPRHTAPTSTRNTHPAPVAVVQADPNAAAQAASAAAKAAAVVAAAQQLAGITAELRAGTDPLARAMVFSAHVNTLGQPS